MSTIFLKSFASGEKCVILEAREALLYTFDFGDWRELRMGFFCSTTQPGQDNQNNPSSAYVDNIIGRDPQSQFFVGFKDNSFALPFGGGEGVVFAGACSIPGMLHGSQSNLNRWSVGGSARMALVSGLVDNGFAYSGTINAVDAEGLIQEMINPAGSGTYARWNCITLRRGGDYWGTGYLSANYGGAEVANADYTVYKCRQMISQAFTFGLLRTPFFVGHIPNLLNSVFIYSPYFSNRLRIHALVVERYQ